MKIKKILIKHYLETGREVTFSTLSKKLSKIMGVKENTAYGYLTSWNRGEDKYSNLLTPELEKRINELL